MYIKIRGIVVVLAMVIALVGCEDIESKEESLAFEIIKSTIEVASIVKEYDIHIPSYDFLTSFLYCQSIEEVIIIDNYNMYLALGESRYIDKYGPIEAVMGENQTNIFKNIDTIMLSNDIGDYSLPNGIANNTGILSQIDKNSNVKIGDHYVTNQLGVNEIFETFGVCDMMLVNHDKMYFIYQMEDIYIKFIFNKGKEVMLSQLIIERKE